MIVRDRDRFAAFILTHGRADNQITHRVLRREGFTGRIVYIVDTEDDTVDALRAAWGHDAEVVVFDKADYEGRFDIGDITGDRRAVVYARNATWHIARELGLERFVQLDDDYYQWLYRFMRDDGKSGHVHARSLDHMWQELLDFQEASGADLVATAQGGDYIGGVDDAKTGLRRKVMNVMFAYADRPVEFLGRINEDATAYVVHGGRGRLFFTVMGLQVNQTMTQQAGGGLTDIYLASGTYVKSFYSVMMAPSCVKINVMGETGDRYHHLIAWGNAVPKIISGAHRKPR